MASVYDWSLTAANNANADASINWAEGQAPSTVNGSARVMMARIKELLNDLGGTPVTAGTANVITVTVNSAFTAYANGIRVAFRASETNTAATTLNVNGIGAKPVVKFTPSGETALVGQEIQDNCIHEVVYCSFLNGASGAWLLLNPIEPAVSPGTGAPYFGGTVPNGWLLCDGTAVSRTTYSALFAAIGTTWGAGNGSTTFNLPDARNDFLRGASGTVPLGTRQSDEIKSHSHSATIDPAGSHQHSVTGSGGNSTGSGYAGEIGSTVDGSSFVTNVAGSHTHTLTITATGGAETRPRNIAINWIIKT